MRPNIHIDNDGHEWPVSGWRCTVCQLPLTPSFPGQRAHPNCYEKEES